MTVSLTDGVVLIRPLVDGDAEAHWAGEDDEIVRWLTGCRSTVESNRLFIAEALRFWEQGGPQFVFGLRDAATDRLAGTIDARTVETYLKPGQVNLAYSVHPQWRGRGYASRAVGLILEFLRGRPGGAEALIRVDPANSRSAAVARRSGFSWCARTDDEHGVLDWFSRPVA